MSTLALYVSSLLCDGEATVYDGDEEDDDDAFPVYLPVIQHKRGLVYENVSGRARHLTAASALLLCHGSVYLDGEEQDNNNSKNKSNK